MGVVRDELRSEGFRRIERCWIRLLVVLVLVGVLLAAGGIGRSVPGLAELLIIFGVVSGLVLLRDLRRAQAQDIPNKLALIGLRPVRGGLRLKLTDAEVDLLAEAEHGRWNVERLLAGWRLGERQVGRSVSPDLRPWGASSGTSTSTTTARRSATSIPSPRNRVGAVAPL